jgi:hypothetical protein
MVGPGILQCTHHINVTINNQSPIQPPFYDNLLGQIFINPMTTIAEPGAITWSTLSLSSTSTSVDVGADYNPYEFNFSAWCDSDGEISKRYVPMKYELSINGTDMTNIDLQTLIPIGNINYSVGLGGANPLSSNVEFIGTYLANIPRFFSFNLTLPDVIQPGVYSGNINLKIVPK